MKLICGNSNRPLAEAIAAHMRVPLAECNVRRFADEVSRGGICFEHSAHRASAGRRRVLRLLSTSSAIHVLVPAAA